MALIARTNRILWFLLAGSGMFIKMVTYLQFQIDVINQLWGTADKLELFFQIGSKISEYSYLEQRVNHTVLLNYAKNLLTKRRLEYEQGIFWAPCGLVHAIFYRNVGTLFLLRDAGDLDFVYDREFSGERFGH